MDDVTPPSSLLPVLAGGEPGEAAPLVDRLRVAVSRRLAANLPVPGSMMQWVDEEMDAFADDSELLGVLFDQLLHAHALDTAIAGAAVLLADVVIDSRAAAAVRAALTVTLAEAATAALREEALDPQGFVSIEAVLRQQTDSERAVRQAVRGEAPRLFAQWDEGPQVMQFALAVLAAACAGTDVITRIASLATVWPETPRAATLALACALAADNEEAIAEALEETVSHPDYNPDAQGDPEALVQSQGLSLLIDLAQREIGPLVFH
ncbi:hypothetical protein OG585_49435 (plasmid) [Streptomyces sp. NBC_01340]|uniref:hypothetical protein n=1 Tax=Streptomyces sp. NBC_01340 TaxID=2903830 RepID=UPI002E1271B8|nr:hypothetical protein OG585_49435 [Streptomyces sp. NBC_01340]